MARRLLTPRFARTSELPIVAIDRAGAATLSDGSVFRVLRVTPRPSSHSGDELSSLHLGILDILGELEPGQALQWYATGRRGTGSGQHSAPDRQLCLVLRETRRRRHGGGQSAQHRSLVRADRLRALLEALDVGATLLDGPAVTRLLLERLYSAAAVPADPVVECIGSLDPAHDGEQATEAANQLRRHLTRAALEFGDERVVNIGGGLEQTLHLSSSPRDAALGWLDPVLLNLESYVLSVVTRAREDATFELRVDVTARVPGPAPDPVRLATTVDAIVHAADSRCGVRMDRGEFAQRALWPATLPFAPEIEDGAYTVDAAVAAAAAPIVSDTCGSPDGVPFVSGAGSSVECLDPWDVAHRRAGVAIVGPLTLVTPQLLAGMVGAVVVAVDFGGALVASAAATPAVQVLSGQPPSALLRAVESAPGATAPCLVVDARDCDEPLACAAAAAALLDGSRQHSQQRATLIIAGAERLLEATGGARWIRRAVARAAADATCIIATAHAARPLADAGLLPLLPIRILLPHASEDVTAAADALDLRATEIAALDASNDGAGSRPVAVWINGGRGRAIVDLATTESAPVAA